MFLGLRDSRCCFGIGETSATPFISAPSLLSQAASIADYGGNVDNDPGNASPRPTSLVPKVECQHMPARPRQMWGRAEQT